MKTDFFSTTKLPPYLFEAIHELKVKEIEQGKEIIDFGMGNPDLSPPEFAMEELAKLVKNPKLYGYSKVGGIDELKKAFCAYYKRRFGVELNYKNESLVTIGVKEGITSLATAISDDEGYIVAPNPSYPIHNFGFVIAKSAVKRIDALSSDEYFLKFKKLVESSDKKPTAIVVSYPSNPTGEIVTLDFYQELVDFCRLHEIYIISDIAYSEIYFGEANKPHSILEVKGAKEVAVEFCSVSKTFCFAGTRVGLVAGNSELIKALHKMKSYLDYGSFAPLQITLAKCFEDKEKSDIYLSNLRIKYQKRADFLIKILDKDLGWKVEKPKATMFVWLKIPEKFSNLTSFEFCKMLIEKAGVALSPGSGFGENGEGFVRFSLIHDEDKIIAAAQSLKKVFLD